MARKRRKFVWNYESGLDNQENSENQQDFGGKTARDYNANDMDGDDFTALFDDINALSSSDGHEESDNSSLEEDEDGELEWGYNPEAEDLKKKYFGGDSENWPMILERLSVFDDIKPVSFEEQDKIWDKLDEVGLEFCTILHRLGLAVPLLLNKIFIRIQGHPFPKEFCPVIKTLAVPLDEDNREIMLKVYQNTYRSDWKEWCEEFLEKTEPAVKILNDLANLDESGFSEEERRMTWLNALYNLRIIGLQTGTSRYLDFPEAHRRIKELIAEYKYLTWEITHNFMRLAIREAIKFSPNAPHFTFENFQNAVEAIMFCVGKYRKGGNFVFYSALWMKDFMTNFVPGLGGNDEDVLWMNDVGVLPDGWSRNITRPSDEYADKLEQEENENFEEKMIMLENSLDIYTDLQKFVIILYNKLADFWDWMHPDKEQDKGLIWDSLVKNINARTEIDPFMGIA